MKGAFSRCREHEEKWRELYVGLSSLTINDWVRLKA